jgi:hypothetical protein
LVGLEARTGADLFIVDLETPLPESIATPPGSLIFGRIAERGVLVQRKTGNDLLQSIPHLTTIQGKMLRHSRLCYLACIGRFEPDHDHHVLVNGKRSGWTYASMQGALDAWQLRGGQLGWFPTDPAFEEWISRWDAQIGKIAAEVAVNPIPDPHTRIASGLYDPIPFRSTLATLPGVGPRLAEDIGMYCGNLAASLWWLSLPDADGVKGFGPTTRAKVRAFLGLQPGQVLLPVNGEDLAQFEIPAPPVNGEWRAASVAAAIETAKRHKTPQPDVHFEGATR